MALPALVHSLIKVKRVDAKVARMLGTKTLRPSSACGAHSCGASASRPASAAGPGDRLPWLLPCLVASFTVCPAAGHGQRPARPPAVVMARWALAAAALGSGVQPHAKRATLFFVRGEQLLVERPANVMQNNTCFWRT